jgi:Flp pilus assembly protein TadG
MLLVLPLLLVVLLGTVEFALWLAGQQQTTLASREGARVAATGGSADDVNAAVGLVLGPARLQQATVTSTLTNSSGNPAQPGDPVSVQVQLPATAVAPDLLIFVGLSIGDKFLVSQTVMRKE